MKIDFYLRYYTQQGQSMWLSGNWTVLGEDDPGQAVVAPHEEQRRQREDESDRQPPDQEALQVSLFAWFRVESNIQRHPHHNAAPQISLS